MRLTSTLVLSLSFVLANTAPTEKYDRVANFQSWNTECGDKSGHTWGMSIIERKYTDLCFPLPDDTRGLDVSELADDCRVTAYRGPTCDDYPYEGAYREKLGCLWAGNTEFRSYKVSCKNAAGTQ